MEARIRKVTGLGLEEKGDSECSRKVRDEGKS